MQQERGATLDQVAMDLCAQFGSGSRPRSVGVRLAELGIDSLACADLALAVEERFGVRLAELEQGSVRTVGDVARAMAHALPARPRIPAGLGRAQKIGRTLGGPPIRWYGRLRVTGMENVPLTGPVVIAPNHRSMLDIPILVVSCPRPVFFMAKIELYRVPLLGMLWHELGGFPVRRQLFDLRAIDTALALLDRGDAVAVYPEGTRNRTRDRLLPLLRGAAWLALRTGASIVPCGVAGTGTRSPLHERRSIRVAFGRPMRVRPSADPGARREKVDELTARLAAAVSELLA